MRLYEKNGKLYFDYEGEYSDIFSFGDYGFKYLGRGLRVFEPPYGDGDVAPSTQNSDLIQSAFKACREARVTITAKAEAYAAELKALGEKQRPELIAARNAEEERKRAEEERRRKAEAWELRKKCGCRGCKALCRDGDDYFCQHAGKYLDEENRPRSYGGTYYLFNFVPLPCEGCMHQFDDGEPKNIIWE